MRKGRLPNLEDAEGAAPVVETASPIAAANTVVEQDGNDVLVAVSEPEVVVQNEPYYRIHLHEKTRHEDPDRVYAAVNGECLYLQRGAEVVLPQRFLEVLNNAVVPQYLLEADERGRAKVGAIRRATYTVLGQSSREEFLKMKQEGRRALNVALSAAPTKTR